MSSLSSRYGHTTVPIRVWLLLRNCAAVHTWCGCALVDDLRWTLLSCLTLRDGLHLSLCRLGLGLRLLSDGLALLLLLAILGRACRRNVQALVDLLGDRLDLGTELLFNTIEIETVFISYEIDSKTKMSETT